MHGFFTPRPSTLTKFPAKQTDNVAFPLEKVLLSSKSACDSNSVLPDTNYDREPDIQNVVKFILCLV